ncbi:GTP-binding protein [archaeon]|nr:GTP-binding protein [archaeon]
MAAAVEVVKKEAKVEEKEKPRRPAIKILVTGPYYSGKSTFVSALCREAVHVDELKTTVGLDFGYEEVGVFELHLFGTPGHDRFAFLQEILAVGSVGILLIVDSSFPETFIWALDILRRVRTDPNIPVVVVANKQDLPGALPPEDVKAEMGLPDDIPVVPCIATKGVGVVEAVRKLIEMIKERDLTKQSGP